MTILLPLLLAASSAPSVSDASVALQLASQAEQLDEQSASLKKRIRKMGFVVKSVKGRVVVYRLTKIEK